MADAIINEDEFLLEEQQEIPIDPLLSLLYLRHTYTSQYSSTEEREAAQASMMAEIYEHNMAPYARFIQEALGWQMDEARLTAMDAAIAERLAAFDAKLKDAEENLGNTEVSETLMEKCLFFARIGDKERCMEANKLCASKTLGGGPRLDLAFQRIRLGIAFSDNELAAKAITDAHTLAKAGDWERRNRLKVYEGIYHVFIRDFRRGSALLLDCVTTFASGELLSFKDFIFVTVVASLPVLSRPELKQKVVDCPEVIAAGVDEVYALASNIYHCRYHEVIPSLDAVCQHQRRMVYVSQHVNYFFREVRVCVFTQFLDSYSSVTLESMGRSFGIPVPVLDAMLCTLISNERIEGKMDHTNRSIRTYRGDNTNLDYHRIVKSGDLLLNRIQKLSRLAEL